MDMKNPDRGWVWPNTPINIVLFEPEIPQNTGNIGRSCAATGSTLHLIKPLGFATDEKAVRRAGLDYWKDVDLQIHESWKDFRQTHPSPRIFFYSTRGTAHYNEVSYQPGDYLVFGPESRGLPAGMLDENPGHVYRVPMCNPVRSLNLAVTAGLVLFEAIRQQQI